MTRPFGYVFPGQGSQSVGMLEHFIHQFPVVNDTLRAASDVLNYDMAALIANGPQSLLDETVHTQPALLATEVAIYRLLQEKKAKQPALMAGHSLGEYAALVCAEAIDFKDAVRIVSLRGKFMQEAVPQGVGAMAAIIGLDNDAVATVCAEAMENKDEIVTPANFNTIGQVVIAGHKAPVERALIIAKKHGAKMAVMIPVSVPSHCALMKQAADNLKNELEKIEIHPLTLPVINNVDVAVYTTPASIIDGLTRQLYSPVRWVEIIDLFIKQGVTRILEVGPNKILSGLNKRIDANLALANTSTMNQFQSWIEEV